MAEAQCHTTISVIIPVHGGGEAFRRCLAGVARTSPPPAETIVVVDGDPQTEVQPDLAGATRVLRLPERSGPAAARNAGAQRGERRRADVRRCGRGAAPRRGGDRR